MVTQESAKLPRTGSIPVLASRELFARMAQLDYRGIRARHFGQNMNSLINLFHCPDGGIGIRARLKIVSRKGCGFDPHSGHSKIKLSLFLSPREGSNLGPSP